MLPHKGFKTGLKKWGLASTTSVCTDSNFMTEEKEILLMGFNYQGSRGQIPDTGTSVQIFYS